MGRCLSSVYLLSCGQAPPHHQPLSLITGQLFQTVYATSSFLARLSVPVGCQTLGILDSNFSSVSEQTHFVKPLSVSPFLVNKKPSLDRSIHIPIADSQAPRQMGVFCDTRFPHGLLCNITVNKTAKCWNGLMEGFFLGQIPKYTTFCAAGHGKQSVPSAAGMGRKLC